jgi:hypothetical protein
MKTFGQAAFAFFSALSPGFIPPNEIEFLCPEKKPEVKKVSGEFFNKYYSDDSERVYILGINPGRFGAGITGIAFTDPVRLENDCGIKNSFAKKAELSSTFIYEMIHKFGDVQSFYKSFFISAICPVGFIKNGKNINYYDDKELLLKSRNFISKSILKQVNFGANRRKVICLGEGKNYSYLKELNNELKIFEEIIPLAHPRFIMQYKRKELNKYIGNYVKVLTMALDKKREQKLKISDLF